jgi:hypothetical protein
MNLDYFFQYMGQKINDIIERNEELVSISSEV